MNQWTQILESHALRMNKLFKKFHLITVLMGGGACTRFFPRVDLSGKQICHISYTLDLCQNVDLDSKTLRSSTATFGDFRKDYMASWICGLSNPIKPDFPTFVSLHNKSKFNAENVKDAGAVSASSIDTEVSHDFLENNYVCKYILIIKCYSLPQ